jgi:hypothetical protein
VFVVDTTPGAEPDASFHHAGKLVAPWIVRDTQGRNRVLPAAILSSERPVLDAGCRWRRVGFLLFLLLLPAMIGFLAQIIRRLS